MRLYLVRHGEAQGSEGRAVGHLDLPLSDLGTRNLEALAASWQGPSPGRLFASDLKRATGSARILAARLGIEPVIDNRLREVSFGAWEGRAWDEVYETDRQRYDAWSERWWDLAPPGGESFADLAVRVHAWFQDLGEGEAPSSSPMEAASELSSSSCWRSPASAPSISNCPRRGSQRSRSRMGDANCCFWISPGGTPLEPVETREEDAMDLDVKHDEKAGKYYALIDGHEAVCEYGKAGEGALNFWHTYVPPELRGKGIADELVRVALDDVLEKGPQGHSLLLVRPRLHRPAPKIQGGRRLRRRVTAGLPREAGKQDVQRI